MKSESSVVSIWQEQCCSLPRGVPFATAQVPEQYDKLLAVAVPLGPMRPVVFSKSNGRLVLRLANLLDAGIADTGVGRIVLDTLEGRLLDGRRTAFLVVQGLLRHARDTTRRSLLSEADRVILRGLLEDSQEAVLRVARHVLTSVDEVRCPDDAVSWLSHTVLPCEASGELLKALCSMVRLLVASPPSHNTTTPLFRFSAVEGALSATSVVRGRLVTFRPQPRFPDISLRDRRFGIAVVTFPKHLTVCTRHDDPFSDGGGSSSSSSDGDERFTAGEPLVAEMGARYASQVVQWAAANEIGILLTPDELREELLLNTFPELRILDGVPRRELAYLQSRCHTRYSLDELQCPFDLESHHTPLRISQMRPDGMCPTVEVLRCTEARTVARGCVRFTLDDDDRTSTSLICAPTLETRKEIVRLLRRALALHTRFASSPLCGASGPRGYAAIAQALLHESSPWASWWGMALMDAAVRAHKLVSGCGDKMLWAASTPLSAAAEPVEHVTEIITASAAALCAVLSLSNTNVLCATTRAPPP